MRILFINEKCGYFGGVEQNIVEAANGLCDKGHECFLAYGEITDKDPEGYQSHFHDCFAISELQDDSASTSHLTITDLVDRIAPDVLYFHKFPDLTPFESLLDKFHSVRMVHDHDLCCPRRHKYFSFNGKVCHHPAGWRCWGDGAFLARSGTSIVSYVSIGGKIREMKRNYYFEKILVGSKFMSDELLMNGFRNDRVHILPPVVRMSQTSPVAVTNRKNILYVGQLIRGKGVDLLLQALAKVRCDYTATIVGTGNAHGRLTTLAESLGLAEKVTFQGWVSHEDLGWYYKESTVVVVPSRWPEPFGMIGIEAMRHGRAVIGFDVGGIPDWLEHDVSGLLVPEQDCDALGKAVERVLNDIELADRLGQQGYERAAKHYSFEKYIDELESLLSDDSGKIS